ncbi:fibroblast growth factor 5 isoform X2 [Osmerus mordax]|uniref:fibroblast growth factor 5 isoform X2 n=1 Tax=Osmerus mordax TaxID=8014 RepID=UPI00350FB83D
MNVPLCLFTFTQLIYLTGSKYVSLEDLPQEEGINSGRRTCRLYCRVGIGFHLQIHPDGRVNGSHEPNQLSVLELFAISQGVIGIKGVHSDRFLAMNKRGRLHAIERFTDDCKFRERFQENSYNTLNLHEQSERGFTITDSRRTERKSCPPPPKPPSSNIYNGMHKRAQTVKYWPKFRFG